MTAEEILYGLETTLYDQSAVFRCFKTVFFLLCFSHFLQEMYDIKYTGKCLAIGVFALIEMVISERENSSLPRTQTYGYSNIFPTRCL